MSRVLQFQVIGLPATKGSGRAVVSRTTGKAFYKPDNPRTKDWQGEIAKAAVIELARPENHGCRFLEGGVYLEVVFYLPRPKALRTARKIALPLPHTTKPDLDKLVRAAKDALSGGVVWSDDAQVVHLVARKRYCGAEDYPRAVLRISEALPDQGRSAAPGDRA